MGRVHQADGVEGGDWTFATIARYHSWQDLASDRMAAAAAARQHSAFPRDTITDRIYPAK